MAEICRPLPSPISTGLTPTGMCAFGSQSLTGTWGGGYKPQRNKSNSTTDKEDGLERGHHFQVQKKKKKQQHDHDNQKSMTHLKVWAGLANQ